MPSKRDHQRLIQGWFDPNIEGEKELIDIVDWLQQNTGLKTDKAVIAAALRALAKADYNIEIPPPSSDFEIRRETAQGLKTLYDAIRMLRQMVNNGTASPLPPAIENDLNAIEQSMADRYQAMNFDDEA